MRKTLDLMTHDCRPITGQAETGKTLELIGQVSWSIWCLNLLKEHFSKQMNKQQHKKHNVNSAK